MTALAPRSALYLPASNPRAIEKARALDADMIILDLEDAVAPADKAAARQAIATMPDYEGRIVAVRINAVGTDWHDDDVAAVRLSSADYIVVPKVERGDEFWQVGLAADRPPLAMIEMPRAVANILDIAKAGRGLIAGTNDLGAELGVPGRAGLLLSLQGIVLAARAYGVWALDGVFNALDDAAGFAAECGEGRSFGFDGKTLVHPSQIAPCNAAFSPTNAEIADAEALVTAAAEGATRFRGRMVEALHVDAARALLARARALRIAD